MPDIYDVEWLREKLAKRFDDNPVVVVHVHIENDVRSNRVYSKLMQDAIIENDPFIIMGGFNGKTICTFAPVWHDMRPYHWWLQPSDRTSKF